MISFYVRFGSYKGFNTIKDGPALRFNLAWMTLWFALVDIEDLMANMLNELKTWDTLVINGEQEKASIYEAFHAKERAYHVVESQLKTAQNELARTRESLETLRLENHRLQVQIEDINIELSDTQDENENLETALDELSDTCEHHKKDLGGLLDWLSRKDE